MNGIYERLILKNGGRFDFWINYRETIARFIKEFDLRAIEREYFAFDDPVPIIPRAAEVSDELYYLRPRPFPGGLRIPHLHFRNDIYLLEPEQWKEFSAMTMDNFREKLTRAEVVSFNQVMELSEAIDGLG